MLKRTSCLFHWESSGDWWGNLTTKYKRRLKNVYRKSMTMILFFYLYCSTVFLEKVTFVLCWTKLNAVENTWAWNISIQIFCKQNISSAQQITNMDSRILEKRNWEFFKIIFLYCIGLGETLHGRNSLWAKPTTSSSIPKSLACPTVVLPCFAYLVFRTIPRPSKATNTRLRLCPWKLR